MKVRQARPEDLPELERLKRAMTYSGSLFQDETSYFQVAVDRLKDCLPRMQELPDWRVLVLVEEEELTGYLVFVIDDEHTVTHQLQTVILDFAVFRFEGLAALVARARKIVSAYENEYLLAELTPAEKRLQLWFYRCGFRAEQTRVAKRIPRGHQGVISPDYRIRRANQADLPFILEVHAAYSSAYRPAGRDTELETLELRYQLAYLALDFDGPENSLYGIMEEVATGASAGYLFIQEGPTFCGERSFYIYDVALAPAFSNRGLSLILKTVAENLVGQEGGLLYGDGSLALPQIASWHAQMGYQVDSIRFALDCRAAHVKTL